MVMILIRAVSWFAILLSNLLLVRAIMSWFVRDPYSPVGKFYMFLIRLTEPIVEPCRRLLERFNLNTGMFDFSVLLAFLLIDIVAGMITTLLAFFL